MAVTDERTLLNAGTTTSASWTDEAGSGSPGNSSTEVFPPGGSGSITDKVSKTDGGLLLNAGAVFAAGDHLYIWYSFLFGALDDVAGTDSTNSGGGIRVRLAGSTITNWAEVFVDGVDSGKSGWQLAVVSLDAVLANPDQTNGTVPTAAASIERVGIIFDVTATVGGNNDNVAIQGIWRSPASLTAAYRIDAGTDGSPNTWQDLIDDSLTNALGIVVEEPNGAITLRAPIVFGPDPGGGGPNDASTFEDAGRVLAWDLSTGLIEPDFYKLTSEAGSGDVRVTAGTKLGSGETAVGVNGWTIISGGPRWRLDFEDTDQDDIQFYGCSFQGAGPFSINDAAVEIISCVFSDCDFITITGGATGCTLLSNFFAGAPGPNAQVVFTSGVTPSDGQFDFNTLVNMSWFAIEIPSATTQFDLRGILFSGNGTNRDVLLSHTTGDIQLNVLENGDTPQVTNGATITVTMTGACDVVAVTAGTWYEALGTETEDQGAQGEPLVTQSTGSLAVDDDTFAFCAISPATKPTTSNELTLDYTGASDDYSDSHFLEIPSHGGGVSLRQGADEITFSAATRTGFPVASEGGFETKEEGVQGIVHVDAAVGSTAVVSLDATNDALGVRELRPWQAAEDSSTLTFSYGAGTSANNARFLYVGVVALDGTAANTLVSGIVLNRSGGTTALSARTTSFPVQDDNVGSTGKSLELHVFDYDVDSGGQDLDQGTFDVNSNVNVTITVNDPDGDPEPGVLVAVYQDNAARTTVIASTSTDENGEVAGSAAASLGAIIIRVRQNTNTADFVTDTGINATTETITTNANHHFQDGDAITYSDDGGSDTIGLTDGTVYFAGNAATNSVQIYDTAVNAIAGTSTGRQDLNGTGTGETHLLDPVRFVQTSATGTIGGGDFTAQISLVTDAIATG